MTTQITKSDSTTEALRNLPVVGGKLASAREAAAFIRPNDSDSTEIRVVKRVAQVTATVATGLVGATVIW